MKVLLLAAVAVVLTHTPAAAMLFCSEPSAPYCATSYSDFDDYDEFERCKRDMGYYADEVNRYIDCLNDAQQSALNEYNDAVDSFNRRVR